MPHVTADDGVKLYYEDTGNGSPLVFAHEFAGDCRSWEPQVRHFSRRYRCITYNARGYPPSDVPPDGSSYSQQRARDDILCILDGLDIERAHVVGLSMGAFATLHFGMAYSHRALSLVVAGLMFVACADYRFTVNDRVLYTPDTVFTGYDIYDAGLAACVKQHVGDKSITSAIQLNELVCSHAGVNNLQGIQIFTGLTRLKLSSNNIAELSPLADLQLLSELHLDGNKLVALNPIRLLPNLTYLNVYGNSQLNCTELANLSRTPNLTLELPEHCANLPKNTGD